jgi:tetratricopeptide (TPR) repeat protein
LAINIKSAEAAEFRSTETDVPQAYDAFLNGWEHYRRQTPQDNARAIAEFERAVEIDPEFGRAYAGLAAVYWNIVLTDWELAAGIEWQHAFDRVTKSIEKAKDLEPTAALAYSVSAELRAMWGEYAKALAEIDRAIALDHNSADSYVSKARILNASGRAEEAEEAARLAMRLNPHYRPGYLRVLGRALFHQERYQEAAEVFERAVSRQPDNYLDYESLASAYGHLGRAEDAKAAVERYNEIMSESDYTPLTLHEAGLWWGVDLYDYDKTYVERFVEGLRKAGVLQGAASQIEDADYKALIRKSSGEYDVKGATKIDETTAKALVERGVVIIDVRDAGSFGRGHIPGAARLDLNVDLTEEHLSRLVNKDDEVIFHCWGKYCPYSTYACAKAVTWGFTQVHYFADGFPAWQDAGYPVEKTKSGS